MVIEQIEKFESVVASAYSQQQAGGAKRGGGAAMPAQK
jgi:hypothetical protein